METMSRFDYVRYDEKACAKQAEAKELCEKLEHFIETKLDNGRAKALAFTKLEEVYMWLGKGIRDEQVLDAGRIAPLQEERGP